jgi:hypothetical protein
MKHARWLAALALLQISFTEPAMAGRPVVLELFTSQGCSSCPPADALLTKLAQDPSLLALSFHINYWDYLGWKDPYASNDTTNRQRSYAAAMGEDNVFTPQLVIDGALSAVGSQSGNVKDSIEKAKNTLPPEATITFSHPSDDLLVDISSAQAKGSDVWLIYFDRSSDTDVRAGENDGHRLVSTNPVTSIQRLGVIDGDKAHYKLAMPKEGVAVIIQTARQGRILGAGSFLKPST